MMSSHYLTRIRSAAQLVAVTTGREPFVCGTAAMNKVATFEPGGMVIGMDGKIVAVGTEDEVARQFDHEGATFENDIDATGKAVLPGLCDGHTHPVWSGDRVHEFAMKLAGATYMDVHKAGGGIGFTVKHCQESSEEELLELFLSRADRMIKNGTLLLEAKSGYGLQYDIELKLLKVLHEAKKHTPLEIVCTYLGAHSVPKSSTAEKATFDIVHRQIPLLQEEMKNGTISPEMIDVFCEKGVFELDDTRKILQAGQKAGLSINFHADELHPLKGAELGAELGATAISHLEWVSDEGIEKMAEKNVVAVLLPTTAYVLRINPPPARKLIDNNVPVALGSDFNPNAHCLSMAFVMNLACVTMKMTMPEALIAATINAAASMNRSSSHGSLEVGKCGDFIILDAPTFNHLIYDFANPPIESVYKDGKIVYEKQKRQRTKL